MYLVIQEMKLYNNDVNVMTDVTNSVSYQCDV